MHDKPSCRREKPEPRIFDPFFTTKPAGVGTGLGLAIVLSVVPKHGGQVSVLSPLDGGSVFTVELPVETEASVEPGRRFLDEGEQVLPVATGSAGRKNRPQALPRDLPQPAPRSNHRGTRVLVIEDEPTVGRLIADVLEDEGLHVDVLLDGREALDRAGRERFDLVICDHENARTGRPEFLPVAGARGIRFRSDSFL